MREASVYAGRTRNTAHAAPGHLGNEHHRRDRWAHLDERVRRGYHPRRGGRYDSGEDTSLVNPLIITTFVAEAKVKTKV